MRILVLGSKGQLGSCLKDNLESSDHEVIYSSREQIDIIDFKETKRKILDILPDLIINATAYTAVDKAEEDQTVADLVNHLAVKNIAEICHYQNIWLIHVSTDYVFDGNSKFPYKEEDNTNPKGVYGQTKLKGELAIQSSQCKYIILRTAWVFSEYGNNFFKTMLRLGVERNELSVVGDQIGCPTYAQDIAKSIVKLISQLHSFNKSGIYHFCGNQSCSWFDFANAIFEQAKINNLKIPRKINSIKTSSYPTPAERPKFSVLDCSKIENDFGIRTSNWNKGIKQVLNKLLLENFIS